MKKSLLFIIISLIVYTSLISGCGRKSPPKRLDDSYYPQVYPKD